MFKCFILYLLHFYFHGGSAQNNVVALGQIPFNGPERGPEIEVEGGGNQIQGLNVEKAKQYYVENINIVQEDIAMRWPLGIVSYYFDMSSYDYVMNSRTREAMDIIEAVSCVRFVSTLLKPDNNSWIHITNPEGLRECMHKPIYKGWEVIVSLGLECLSRREVVHTLLHAIGFRDEVTHPQRDQFIRVIWENIQPLIWFPGYKPLFRRQPDEGPSQSLVEYDPMSIMQFHDRAYSRNGYATIAGLLPGLQIRPSEGLSQLDKMKLRLLFGHECNRRSVDDLLDTCKREFRNDHEYQKNEYSGSDAEGFNGGISESALSGGAAYGGTASGSAVSGGAASGGAAFDGAASGGKVFDEVSGGGASDGAASGGAASEGVASGAAASDGAVSGGVASDGAASGSAASGGAASDGAASGGAESEYVASGGATSDKAKSGGGESDGVAFGGAASDGGAESSAPFRSKSSMRLAHARANVSNFKGNFISEDSSAVEERTSNDSRVSSDSNFQLDGRIGTIFEKSKKILNSH